MQVSYKFHADCGTDCDSFLLDSSTGRISANVDSFDSSQKTGYILRIVAQDGANSALPRTTGPNQGTNNCCCLIVYDILVMPYFLIFCFATCAGTNLYVVLSY